MTTVDADPERLARSLILTDENEVSRALCLADFTEALDRCDTPAERADVALATIRLYSRRSGGEGADHAE